MLLRLIPQRGGDGTVHGIIAMNDTWSDALTIFDMDLPHLGNFQGYTGWNGQTAVRNANGTIDVCWAIFVQVQLVRDDDSPWSEWIDEDAIVQQAGPGYRGSQVLESGMSCISVPHQAIIPWPSASLKVG